MKEGQTAYQRSVEQKHRLDAYQELLHELESGQIPEAVHTLRHLARVFDDLDLGNDKLIQWVKETI